jgi:hypothetical protein
LEFEWVHFSFFGASAENGAEHFEGRFHSMCRNAEGIRLIWNGKVSVELQLYLRSHDMQSVVHESGPLVYCTDKERISIQALEESINGERSDLL